MKPPKKVAQVRSELALKKSEKDGIARDIDVYSPEALSAEIKKIQDKLGYGQLSVTEEKNLIEKKRRLEGQKEKVKKFQELKKQSNEIYTKSEVDFKLVAELRKQREEVKARHDIAKEKFGKIKASEKAHGDNIPILKGQIDSIRKDIDELKAKKDKIYEEWDGKWDVYNDQQHLINYIRNAEKKKENLKRQVEYLKSKAEKEKAKEETKDSYGERIWACEWLITYFTAQVGSSTVPEKKEETKQTKEEDVKKAALKPIVKKEEDLFALSDSQQTSKKKDKGPKVSKREQKIQDAGFLQFDTNMIKKIKEIGLNPPVVKNDCSKFLKQLQEKQEEFKKLSEEEKRQNEEKRKESAKAQETNVEDTTKTVAKEVKNVVETPKTDSV